MSQKHYRIRVTGHVQGVFYRVHTIEKAQELGLKGTVKNQDDGSVLIEAEGEESKLQELLNWCYKGSPEADVEQVEVEESEVVGYENFHQE